MKKFKKYVVEEYHFSVFTPVNSESMIEFFESIDIKKYKAVMDFIVESNGTNYIYRGLQGRHFMDFIEVTPSKSERKSANEKTNIYNLLVSDILQNWSGYPKRNKSAICSTSKMTSSSFGKVYVVIPQNNARFGICTTDDFWMSFDNTFEEFDINSMNAFSLFMLQFIIYCGRVLQIQTIQKTDMMGLTAQSLKHILELISKELNIHSTINNKKTNDINLILKYAAYRDHRFGNAEHDEFMENNRVKRLTEMFHKYTKGDTINLIEILDEALDPHRNGFQLSDFDTLIGNVNSRKLKDNEVWTDSDILLIREDMMNEFIEYYIHHS